MTSADTPYRRASAVARGWRTFRRWRRGRPFWGGVITILSGVVFFLSGHITFGGIKISFGPEEFLGWVIPLLLVLCGLLTLITPAQRIFYGVLAAAISVGGLLGLNLGGFFVGMLLGMVGGALGASWAPVQLPPEAGTPPATDGPLPADEEDEPVEEPESYPLSGLLGDTLPTSTTSPLGVPPVEAPDPGDPLPRRSPRGLAVILLVVATAAGLGLGMVRTAWPASAAETCAAAPAAAAATKPATTRAPSRAAAPPAATTPAAAPTTPAAAAASSAAPTSSPTSSAGGGTTLGDTVRNLVSDVVDGVGKLLGIGDQPDPSATPSTTAPADPAPTSPASGASPTPAPPAADPTPAPRSTTAAPKRTPTQSPSPTCATAKALAAPADNTKVAVKPATQITATLKQVHLTFDGVTALPTANGSIAVLEFSMDSSESTPFELQVSVNGRTLDYRSSDLTVSGHVRFYTSRLDVAGIVITPDSPLELFLQLFQGVTSPIDITFPNVNLDLVLVRADTLTAPDLTIAYQ